MKIDQSNEYFLYVFESVNDSLLLIESKQSYDVYDTLYTRSFSIDSLIHCNRSDVDTSMNKKTR